MVKFVNAVAYHACLNSSVTFSQSRKSYKRMPSKCLLNCTPGSTRHLRRDRGGGVQRWREREGEGRKRRVCAPVGLLVRTRGGGDRGSPARSPFARRRMFEEERVSKMRSADWVEGRSERNSISARNSTKGLEFKILKSYFSVSNT